MATGDGRLTTGDGKMMTNDGKMRTEDGARGSLFGRGKLAGVVVKMEGL